MKESLETRVFQISYYISLSLVEVRLSKKSTRLFVLSTNPLSNGTVPPFIPSGGPPLTPIGDRVSNTSVSFNFSITHTHTLGQLAGAVEYTDCFSAEG